MKLKHHDKNHSFRKILKSYFLGTFLVDQIFWGLNFCIKSYAYI